MMEPSDSTMLVCDTVRVCVLHRVLSSTTMSDPRSKGGKSGLSSVDPRAWDGNLTHMARGGFALFNRYWGITRIPGFLYEQ